MMLSVCVEVTRVAENKDVVCVGVNTKETSVRQDKHAELQHTVSKWQAEVQTGNMWSGFHSHYVAVTTVQHYK